MVGMNTIRGILVLVYFLGIAPYLIGSLLCHKLEGDLRNSIILRYVTGFFSQIGIWGFVALPVTLFFEDSFPFHLLCRLYFILIVALSFVRVLLVYIYKESVQELFLSSLSSTRLYFNANLICRMLLSLCGIASLAQMCVVIYSIRKAYDDNTVYIAGVTETIYYDRIMFREILRNKLILAPWHTYWAFLTKASGFHGIFICETVLPVVIYVLFFFNMILIVEYIFRGDRTITVYAVFITLLSIGFCKNLFAMYNLAYNPVIWGKVILYTTALPFVLLLFFLFMDQTASATIVPMTILTCAGVAWLSMVSVGSVFLTFIMLGIYYVLVKGELYAIKKVILFLIPSVCQIGAYFIWYCRDRF